MDSTTETGPDAADPDALLPEPQADILFKRVTDRLDRWIAGALALFFFLVHSATSSFWVFPGDSAHLLSLVIRAEPLAAPRDQAFLSVFRALAGVAGASRAAAAAAVGTLFFSSLCAGAVYLLSSAVYRLLLDENHLRALIRGGARAASWTPRAAGVLASLSLGFSAPFWTASSRLNAHGFHLFFLLCCGYLLVWFVATDSIAPLWAASALYGALCTQFPTAIQFLPVLLVAVLFGALRSERPFWKTLGMPAVLSASAALLAALACVEAFRLGDGYRLMRYYGPGAAMNELVFGSFAQAFAGMTQPRWLVLGTIVVVPWLAWIAAGRWGLDGTGAAPLVLLDAAILAASLLVLLGSRYSPWGIFGFQPEQVTGCAMAAMSFGYCALAVHQRLLFLFFRNHPLVFPGERWIGLVLRVALGVGLVFLLAFQARTARVQADARKASFLRVYTDAVLDSLGRRDVIVTDRIFDHLFRIRAKERGIPLSVIDLGASPGSVGRRALRERIADPVLRNAFDLGDFPFLQEWVGHHPDARNRLALTFFPDIWNLGSCRAYPAGMVFVGVPDGADVRDPLGEGGDDPVAANVRRWLDTAALLEPQLDAVNEDDSPAMRASADAVRRRVSFIGNNLGYFLEAVRRPDEARELYVRVHAFDPGNVSTMLNLYTLLGKQGREEEKESMKEELETFRRKLDRPFQIWELSRSQGYVASPDAFASLGLSWALTGQTPLALGTLESALRDGVATSDSERGVSPLLLAMGAIQERMSDTEGAEKTFRKMLEIDPDNPTALFGVVRARLARGETEGVEDLLRRLRLSGLDPARLVHAQTSLLLQRKDADGALRFAQAALATSPRDPDILLDVFLASVSQYTGDTNATVRVDARKRMEDVVQRLRADPSSRTFQGAVASAALHMVDGEWADAREEFRIADKAMPGVPALLNQILRLDYGLADRVMAEDHARRLLQLVPRHGFAAYVMGSLMLERSDYPSARAWLDIAVEHWGGVPALGNLAYLEVMEGQYEKAESLSREALGRAPRFHEIWDTLGLALLGQKRPEEAREAFRESLRRRPDARVAHLHLARAELACGERNVALSILSELTDGAHRFLGEDRAFFDELWSELHPGQLSPTAKP